MLSGTTLAHAITLVAAPILSRLYSPVSFGIFGLYTAIVGPIAVVAAWRYELAVVLPEQDEDAANLLVLAGGLTAVMVALSTVLVVLGGRWIVTVLNSPQIAPWLWWVPVSVLGSGLFQLLTYWGSRKKSFREIATARLVRSASAASIQSGGGLFNAGPAGLIAGQVAGQTFASVKLLLQVWRDDRTLIRRGFAVERVKRLAREYAEFPRFGSLQGLLSAIQESLPAFLLMPMFGPEVVGFYGLAYRLLQLPVRLITQSTWQVFLQRMTEAYNTGQGLHALHKKATLGLAAVGLLPTVAVMLLGPQLFSFALGANWATAGRYSQLLAPWLFIIFIYPPSLAITTILKKQRWLFVWNLAQLTFGILALLIGGYLSDPMMGIALYSLVGLISYLVLVGWMWIITKGT
jgi:O-antigen/teichoic acid export membrane protein